MPVDGPGSPAPLPRLADLLGRAAPDARPTPLELAELLWLAGQMESAEAGPPESRDEARAPGPTPPAPRTAPEQDHRHRPDRPPRPARPTEPVLPPGTPRTPLRLPSPAPAPGASAAEPHRALLAPAPPMLRHPLALQRALRPLKRRTDAPVGHEVDEAATADRIARLGAGPEWWLPVLRPVRERWLRLNLVHDAGPTMPVWQPLVRELHAALVQSGVFRTVALRRADPDGTVRGGGVDTPADGRTVTLLISDCMGPQWREGPAGTRWFGTLRRWAHRTPLAVLQPLPEQLWRDTALPPVPGRLSAPHRAAPSASLTFTPYDATAPRAPETAVHVPVLEPGPEWLANWAALVASPGGGEYPAAAAALHRPLPADADDRTDVARLSAEELVLRFRASASPPAFRLAGHLALGRPDLPVMRLVQAAVEPHPLPQHLAEVILSGLLTTVAGPPGSYAFRPGVRDLLLRGLPRTARNRTHELLLRTGGLIDERAGRAPGEFRALIPDRDGTERADGKEPFAAINQESARQLAARERPPAPSPFPPALGARYRPVRRLAPTGRMWLAEDTETNRTVTIRLHGAKDGPAARKAFLRDARRLTEITHPNVVTVLDCGIEGDVPYVVMEHLDGIALNTLARSGGRRLPAPLTVSVGAQLARGLTALHEAGVTHGGLEASRVVLLPDGTARLSLFAPGRTSGPAGRAEDLRALCDVLLLLTSGTSHLAVPIDSRRLDRLPGALRIHYAHAFDQLMSASSATQARGLELLVDPHVPARAGEAYAPRRYRALGPLRVDLPDGTPALPPEVRALLAMLLLKHGRTVTHEELRWGLWDPGDEPRDPRRELTRLATRLADVLGPGVLATSAHGYALHTSADDVDVVHCDELVRRADAAGLAGALTESRAHVTGALALWRGPEPLADVPGPAARTARTRLARLRLALYTKRAELDLSLGEYDRAATDLAGLLSAHPHREDFRRLYMIALRRQGRGEEALEVYEEYELTGGRSPALAALGRELREEHAGPADDSPWQVYEDPAGSDGTVSAPDELPEGPFPTEDGLWTPLSGEAEGPAEAEAEAAEAVTASAAWGDGPHHAPDADPRDARERAELLAEIAAEAADLDADADEGFEEVFEEGDAGFDTDHRACARYSVADGPRGDAAHATLRRVAAELLADSGLDAAAYRVHDDPDGVLVLLEPRTGVAGLLRATLEGLPGQWARTGGLRLRAEFWQVEFPVDGDGGEQVLRAAPESADAALEASGAPAVVVVSDSLYHDEVHGEEGQDGPAFPPDLFRPLDDDTGWYHLVERAGSGAPGRARTRRPASPADLIAGARCVLLGFDDVLARLYRPAAEREVMLDIARLLVEDRDPGDALAGVPLPRAAADGYGDTLGFVRALAGHRLADDVRLRLDRHEARAARTARPTPLADRLVRALHVRRVPVAVVTDRAPGPVTAHLRRRGLLDALPGGVHGRDADLTRLMPDPDVLHRALERLDVAPGECVLVGSRAAEQSAARAIGMPFIGYWRGERVRRDLRAADGGAFLVTDLRPLLSAVEDA
ncbi:putative serine/threonine protein kinase (Regulator) [Streptomyces ambofaciens ATCC 23877]|uniref:Putative serine/threonine protein kinase (Regulator) n=1 Tax=Streptomyces ambofaciens (strain ATCC 23877 / 3486 / DSM 40053 / JCM 4204 / NBRC 12836 / NRRL B-2516) TaxID=278992 RepID=A0A0K2ARE5_STRA7|nr:SAV_2336 N-terminal domain-related protein [Streptomyces ambofaciens]AKZ55558.1 putative serine/threonine protein kinase (Regulator) [Streptomyces ambofaciens ATCC 23877]